MAKRISGMVKQFIVRSNKNIPPTGNHSIQAGNIDKDEIGKITFLYEIIHERLIVQKEQWTALDVKTNFILGYATALISAALVLQAVILTLAGTKDNLLQRLLPQLPGRSVLILLLIPLLVFYIITVILGIFAYKPRTYKVIPDPEIIFQELKGEGEILIKRIVIEKMIDIFKFNQWEIEKKVRLIDFALGTLFVEAFLLVPLILFQVLV